MRRLRICKRARMCSTVMSRGRVGGRGVRGVKGGGAKVHSKAFTGVKGQPRRHVFTFDKNELKEKKKDKICKMGKKKIIQE